MEPKTSSTPDDARIEVSIVRSPEVFGSEKAATGETSSSASDEKCIEKKDQSPRPKSEEIVVLESDTVTSHNHNNTNGNDVKASPESEGIHAALMSWQWVYIDGIKVPALQRGNQFYLAVHNVQLTLLSRFSPALSADLLQKFTMVSHKMTQAEAWVFNSVNAVSRRCTLGCQLYVADDELVLLRDVELFYWNVKAINLSAMIKKYTEEHEKAHDNIQLMSVIYTIKNFVEAELEECKTHIQKIEAEQALLPQATVTQHSTPPNVSPGVATNSTPNSIHADSINVFS